MYYIKMTDTKIQEVVAVIDRSDLMMKQKDVSRY